MGYVNYSFSFFFFLSKKNEIPILIIYYGAYAFTQILLCDPVK